MAEALLLKEHLAVALSLHGCEDQAHEFTEREDTWIDLHGSCMVQQINLYVPLVRHH